MPTRTELRAVAKASYERNEAGYRLLASPRPPTSGGIGGRRAMLSGLGDAALRSDPMAWFLATGVLVGLYAEPTFRAIADLIERIYG